MPRWIRILAGAALGMAVLFGLSRWPRPDPRPPTPPPPRDVVKIEIQRPEGFVVLEKNGDLWRVIAPVNAPAGEGVVTGVLSSLNALKLEAVLSHRPENHRIFEVDEASGTKLRVWSAGDTAPTEWVIGRNTPDLSRAYLRRSGDPRVYLAQGVDRENLHGEANRWREGRLFPLPTQARVRTIRVDRGTTRLLLERSTAGWTVNGRPAHPMKAEGFENRLRYLAAEDFIDAPAASPARFGLGRPSVVLTLVLEDGSPHVVRFGVTEKSPTTRTIAQREGDTTLYWLGGTPEVFSVTADLFLP